EPAHGDEYPTGDEQANRRTRSTDLQQHADSLTAALVEQAADEPPQLVTAPPADGTADSATHRHKRLGAHRRTGAAGADRADVAPARRGRALEGGLARTVALGEMG